MDYKANELTDFCDEMRELIQEQQQDIEKAFVMDSGPYHVRNEYKALALQPTEWVKMGCIARETYLQKVSNASLHPIVSAHTYDRLVNAIELKVILRI